VSFSGRNLDEVAHNSITDLGSRSSIDNARSRFAHSEKLKRIARGLYESPRMDQLLGEFSPDLDKVAAAMAGYQGIRLQPTEAYSANRLHPHSDGEGLPRHPRPLREATPTF
jgi:hypothetical protein